MANDEVILGGSLVFLICAVLVSWPALPVGERVLRRSGIKPAEVAAYLTFAGVTGIATANTEHDSAWRWVVLGMAVGLIPAMLLLVVLGQHRLRRRSRDG